MSKTEQKELSVEQELEAMEKRLKEGIDAVVVDVSKVMSHDYYNNKDYDNREGLKVVARTADDLEISDFLGIPEQRGLYKSKMYAFKRRYGKYPTVDMTVRLVLDTDGFWRIDY